MHMPQTKKLKHISTIHLLGIQQIYGNNPGILSEHTSAIIFDYALY